jgi:hypothetical protein
MENTLVAWAAGLLEGEGHFGLRRGGKDLLVQIGMTDKDVVDRFYNVFGVGSRKSRILPSGKTFYSVTIAAQKDAELVMRAVLPFMGERRSAKILHCLAEHAKVPAPMKEWTHCKHGHELAGENLRIITEGKYTKRRCVTCGRDRQRKHRASDASGIFAL